MKGLGKENQAPGAAGIPQTLGMLPLGCSLGAWGGPALTRGVIAVSLVPLDVLGPVAVGGVEEVNVLIVVAGQELWGGRERRGQHVEVLNPPGSGAAVPVVTHRSRHGCRPGR